MEIQKDRFINPVTGVVNENCTSLVELTYQESLDFDNGSGLSRAIAIIRNCAKLGLNRNALKQRLSGSAFDGQYNAESSLHVDRHLKQELDLKEAQRSYWDWCHKQERVVKAIKQHDDGTFYANVCCINGFSMFYSSHIMFLTNI